MNGAGANEEQGGVLRLDDLHQQHFNVSGPNDATVALIRTLCPRVVAEIGIYEGDTSLEIARALPDDGVLHLFDFQHRVDRVVARLAADGFTNVVGHGNSTKGLDSYDWSLMKVLREHPEPIFDYVFLDGAHTWQVDALAFVLADRLLRPGGHIDFDDYSWSLGSSPTMSPAVHAATSELYPHEQVDEEHVRLIVELLVRRDGRYEEVVQNKLFRKVGA